MNERIKELAAECGFRSNPDIYDRNQSLDIPHFAELIIEECIKVVRDHSLISFGIDPDTFTGTVAAAEKLKEHFGIKEC